MKNEELMKTTLLFKRLDGDDLEKISKIISEKKFQPGDIICKEQEKAKSILVIKSGAVRIAKGDEEVEIVILGPGEALGEFSFLDSGTCSASAMAVDSTLALEISFSKLHRLLEHDVKLAKNFYKSAAEYITQRLRKTTGDLQFSKEFVAKYVKYF